MTREMAAITEEVVEKRIIVLRGSKVILSNDLARLYDVEHRVLMQAVKRNMDRFPSDFMFQLSRNELEAIKTQGQFTKEITTATGEAGGNSQRGKHMKYLPFAFTEQGVAMLSSVLRSKRAIQVNIEIMRTFVNLQRMMVSYSEISQKIEKMEKKYDAQFRIVFDAIRQLMAPPHPRKNQVGFHAELVTPARKKSPARKRTPAKKK